jgi:hypothetical protein
MGFSRFFVSSATVLVSDHSRRSCEGESPVGGKPFFIFFFIFFFHYFLPSRQQKSRDNEIFDCSRHSCPDQWGTGLEVRQHKSKKERKKVKKKKVKKKSIMELLKEKNILLKEKKKNDCDCDFV